MLMKLPILSTLLTLATTGFLSAAVVNISGNTTGGPTFTRTTETGFLSSQSGVPYAQYNVIVDTPGIYTFSVAAINPVFYDTFIHLYETSFNPADPENNFLAANDDFTGDPTDGSSLGFNLAAGSNYVFLVDGLFGEGSPDEGAFSGTIGGPGTASVTAVPEPSAGLAAMVSVVFGIAFCGRRRASK
jgi:hypothetical protein